MFNDWISGQRGERLTAWAGPLVIAVTTAAMLWWTWGTWPDVLIDFGAQLYVAWQIADGHTPYISIAGSYKGPLSAHLNALWFQLFGVNLQALVIFNLFILAGMICLLYRLLLQVSDRLAATTACLILVTLFAFSQYVGIGNYNFVCPYSHEVTHALVLSLSAISCLSAYHQQSRWPWLVGIGLSLGLVFLTDPHIFAAATLAVLTGLGLTLYVDRPRWRRIAAIVAFVVGTAAVPPLVTFFLFYRSMAAAEALASTLGSWPWLLGHDFANHTFYRWSIGTIDTGTNVIRMLHWTIGYVVVFGLAVGLSRLRLQSQIQRFVLLTGIFLGLVMLLIWLPIDWLEVARPLPVLLFGMGIIWVVRFLRASQEARECERIIVRLTLIVLALALLGKMILNARFYHYGFALAMPAMLLLVAAHVSWAPASLTKQGRDGSIFLVVGLAVLCVVIISHLRVTQFRLEQKVYVVGKGPDAFHADARGIYVNKAIEAIARYVGTDQTLAVLPEGAMINYLARRKNPTPHINLVPFAFLLLGEASIRDSFQLHPPDYIVFVHKDTSEEGFRFFGRDYGQELYGWIRNHYQPMQLIGDLPLQNDRFGILLLRRNAPQ